MHSLRRSFTALLVVCSCLSAGAAHANDDWRTFAKRRDDANKLRTQATKDQQLRTQKLAKTTGSIFSRGNRNEHEWADKGTHITRPALNHMGAGDIYSRTGNAHETILSQASHGRTGTSSQYARLATQSRTIGSNFSSTHPYGETFSETMAAQVKADEHRSRFSWNDRATQPAWHTNGANPLRLPPANR